MSEQFENIDWKPLDLKKIKKGDLICWGGSHFNAFKIAKLAIVKKINIKNKLLDVFVFWTRTGKYNLNFENWKGAYINWRGVEFQMKYFKEKKC